jgi:hypothetical protein
LGVLYAIDHALHCTIYSMCALLIQVMS